MILGFTTCALLNPCLCPDGGSSGIVSPNRASASGPGGGDLRWPLGASREVSIYCMENFAPVPKMLTWRHPISFHFAWPRWPIPAMFRFLLTYAVCPRCRVLKCRPSCCSRLLSPHPTPTLPWSSPSLLLSGPLSPLLAFSPRPLSAQRICHHAYIPRASGYFAEYRD